MTGFNPSFTFGARDSKSTSTAREREREREPLLPPPSHNNSSGNNDRRRSYGNGNGDGNGDRRRSYGGAEEVGPPPGSGNGNGNGGERRRSHGGGVGPNDERRRSYGGAGIDDRRKSYAGEDDGQVDRGGMGGLDGGGRDQGEGNGPGENPFGFLETEEQAKLPVFRTIHLIRREIIANIDDPYTFEQLRGPRLMKQVVRPLIERFYDPKDISTIFCFLANRVHFLRYSHHSRPSHQSVSYTRATLCELLAIRLLRRFAEDYPSLRGLMVLANVLVSGFDTFQNAPAEIAAEHSRAFRWADQGRIARARKLTALEVAIISDAKNMLCSRPCQRVIEAIYQGKIIYTPTSFIDILPDHYKHKSICLYDPRESPILDQYRLIVPRTRYYLEIIHFVTLMALYVWQMETRRTGHFTLPETVFCVYAFGWMLDQCATILEHGWSVYTQNLWTYLDVSFSASFLLYFILRLVGHGYDHPGTTEVAFDILAMGAPFLVPRLAFNILSENMLFVSLREMMSNFIILTLLAVWSFGGFLLASSWMSRGTHSPGTIAKYMLWLWFGLDASGIQVAPEFHPILGPVLMISFAFLGNTLFLTILVSMLSNTFATITANAHAEIQYRRTVVTFEGVKADAIFSFPPPFNLAAVFILLPLKMCVSPRWFHKTIVYSVRAINAPLLLLISFWERRSLWTDAAPGWYKSFRDTLRWDVSSMAVHGDLSTVFDADPPSEVATGTRGSLAGPLWGNQVPFLNLPGGDRGSVDSTAAVNGDASGGAQGRDWRKDSLAAFFGGHMAMNAHLSGHGAGGDQGRKESMGPFSEITEHLQELFAEHGVGKVGGNGEADEGVRKRLEALEMGLGRLEGLMTGIAEKVGVGAEGDEEDEEEEKAVDFEEVDREIEDVGRGLEG